MRKPSEMYVASRMQDMVQIHAWNACFATKLHVVFLFRNNSFGALGVGAPKAAPSEAWRLGLNSSSRHAKVCGEDFSLSTDYFQMNTNQEAEKYVSDRTPIRNQPEAQLKLPLIGCLCCNP